MSNSLLLALSVLLACSAPAFCADDKGAARADEEPDPQPRVVLPDESMYSPSPQDGGGSVMVTPTTVQAGRPCTLTFVYTAGEKGIQPGGGVLCYVTRFWFWSPPQNASPQRSGFFTVTCTDPDVSFSVKVDPYNQTILAQIEGKPLRAGDQLTFTYGDTSGGQFPQARGIADRFAERGEAFYFKVDGDGDGWFAPIAEQPRFDVLAGEAVRLVVFGPSRVAVGDPFELRVSALDAANNLAESFTGDVLLTFDEEVVAGPAKAIFALADHGSIGVRFVPQHVGATVFAVRVPEDHLPATISNVIVVHEPGRQKYQLYWADLQIHGNLSDGTGLPTDIYRYARDVAGLDAAALTEHDHWGYLPLDDNEVAWRHILRVTAAFNEDGRFVTFPAYEWTNWTFGHQHVLFLHQEDAVVRAWCDPKSDHPQELWKALRGVECVAIPHHTGGAPIPTCWKYHDPVLQPVVEIVSVHGVSERMGQPGCIRGAEESGMVQSALARGYRLGLIGGGDTHDGHPGIGSPGMPPPGLAGIWAKDLTRKSIFEAIRARRVYATTGCRAILRFHSGAVPMGGVIKLTDANTPRALEVAVVGAAPTTAITIVKNNQDIERFEANNLVVTHRWQDTVPAKTGDYYYVRIVQADGGWIWSSPIWVEVR